MRTLRSQVAYLLQVSGDEGHALGRLIDRLLITLIALNVLATILESIPSMARLYELPFYAFEVFSVAVFSIEYLLRVWSCVDLPCGRYKHPVFGRIRYLFSLLALIDLLAILPFYLFFFMQIDLRFLRILRLLRVLKLTRYSGAFVALNQVLKDQARSIVAAFTLLLMMLVLAAAAMHIVERDVQPAAFGSIPHAMWWALVTLTTVGYGDVVPVTALGKVIAGFVAVIGVCMAALPAGLLASGFSAQFLRQNREYAQVVDRALSDGELSPEEAEALERLRDSMGISVEDADLLLRDAIRELRLNLQHCPHCGEAINQPGTHREK